MKQRIHSLSAPDVIGPYSQAIQSGHTVYLSGQIPLDPDTMTMVSGDIEKEIKQVCLNLQAVCMAAGGNCDAIVKLTIYLVDLAHFAVVNEVMAGFFSEPYPARTTIQVAALPKGARIEMDAIMILR